MNPSQRLIRPATAAETPWQAFVAVSVERGDKEGSARLGRTRGACGGLEGACYALYLLKVAQGEGRAITVRRGTTKPARLCYKRHVFAGAGR